MSQQAPRAAEAQPFATATPLEPPGKALRQRAWLQPLVACLLAALLGLAQPLPPAALALSDAQQLVVEAWRLVNRSYVNPAHLEEVRWRQLRQRTLERPIASSEQAYAAIESMLGPIGDPYTRLLRPAEYAALRSNTRGTVSGVGLQLALRSEDEAIVVIAPLAGSPAAEAGIASGTEVLRVNGTPTAELGLDGTASRLRGANGTEVLVELRAAKGRPREVVLQRREVDLRPVRWQRLRCRGHELGYLRLTQFSEPVPPEVHAVLEDFAGRRADAAVEGLILDLRNNTGGLVSAGVAVANELLDGEPIVETQDRGGIGSRQQATSGSVYAGPLLTLVNGGTASASEILAGALQDAGRSELAGSRTFGKGLIQTLVSLGDGSGLAVTVARYLTPGGRDIQNQGIVPDRTLSPPEPLDPGGEGDAWLRSAEDLLVARLEGSPLPAPEGPVP